MIRARIAALARCGHALGGARTLECIGGGQAMAALTLTIERVLAFNGLDVLVARDEGLFAAEGLDLRIAALPPGEIRSAAEGTLAKPVTNQGRLQDRGEAAMFQG
jgi:ABC-type nitrate/sulfonate/bicarbonate transport system substrate-binding protein